VLSIISENWPVLTSETDPKLFDKLGEICESLHRREEARVWYQLAIGRDPLDSRAHQALARLDQAAPEKVSDSPAKPDENR